MSRDDPAIARWLEERRNLNSSRMSRREAARLGLMIGGGMVLGVRGGRARAQTAPVPLYPPSPPTRAFIDRMPLPGVLQPVATPLDPAPDPAYHQYYWMFPPQKHYLVQVGEYPHRWHSDLPASPLWGSSYVYPGPTIDMRYGEPVLVRTVNNLPSIAEHRGFGYPSLTMHLHNFHTASESDGGPWNWVDPGQFKDRHYTLARAGFSEPGRIPAEFRAGLDGRSGGDGSGGDVRETLTSLFQHDHRPGFTAPNVYKGVMGAVRVFDELDTGDEQTGWGLPSGQFDVPIVIADKRFDDQGALYFDQFTTDGFIGDKLTVNGVIQPYMEVKRRKYRFRIYNPGPSRFYNLVLRQGGRNQSFTQITEDGNFLQAPERVTSVQIWVAQRVDIIINFSAFRSGDRLYLANTAEMRENGRGMRKPTGLSPDRVENQCLEFRVTSDVAFDPSRVPSVFRPYPSLDASDAVRTRSFKLGRKNGLWTINDQLWDPDVDHTPERLLNPDNPVRRNSAEIWRIESESTGWAHPLHIHFEEGQILSENGLAPARRARRDMYRMGDNGSRKTEVLYRFRDFPEPGFAVPGAGRYVMHCHNTLHEDHAMMATWNIVP